MTVHNGTSFPVSPTPIEAQLFFRTDEDKLYFYDGAAWVEVGTGGAGGGIASYLHNQVASLATWTVTHNLNDSNPIVEIFDSAGDPVEPQSIDIVDANSFTVTFGSAQTGKVRVHAGVFAGGLGTGNFLPDTTSAYDIGSATFKWKDGYFSGKLTVDGGIDPTYLQITPQGTEPDVSKNNKLWIDSADSNKMKFKNNAGTSNEVVDFSHVGTTANKIIQLDGSAKIPAVDGSLLTSVDASTLGTKSVGTGADNIIALDGSAKLPAVDGSALTSLPAPSMSDKALSVLPTISGWNTDPTNLANITDGDLGTSAVTGTVTTSTSNYAYFIIDLGEIKGIASVDVKTGLWANRTAYSTVTGALIQISQDNVTWTTIGTEQVVSSLTEVIKTFIAFPTIFARYVRIRHRTTAVGAYSYGYQKLYSVIVIAM